MPPAPLVIVASLVLLASPLQAAEPAPRPEPALAAALQPLRPLPNPPSALKSAVAAHRRGKHGQACQQAEALRARLLREAARLFYAPKREGADLDGIDRFLDAHVRGPAPLLEIPAEVFAPSAAFRALGVDACLRAGKPDLAVRFVADAAASGDATVRLALAVAVAQQQGSWAAGASLLGPERQDVRAHLLRALAAGGRQGARHLASARQAALLPQEQQLVGEVARTLGEAP